MPAAPAGTLAAHRLRLRQSCDIVFPGFRTLSPAEEFRAVADWCEANGVTHDQYGQGDLLAAFEDTVAGLLGKQAAAFMPSGVMAQLIALRLWTEVSGVPRFGMPHTSHLALHEEEAYQALFNFHGVPVGERRRPLLARDLAAVAQPLACLLVELPLREIGGQLPEWDELQALKEMARARQLPLHMDGARLWESRAYYGRSYAEIAAGFASVYVSVYKGIGGIAGAVLAGDADFIDNARLWQRRLGGTLVRQSPMVATAAMRFEARLGQMDACYRRTLDLAAGLSALPGIRLNPAIPQTNMLHLFFDRPADQVAETRDAIASSDGRWVAGEIRPTDVPGWSVTELYVGDTLLGLDNTRVLPYFARLVGA
ncbi:threonine aldolase family protein [Nitrospirillum pindoramense]|uniref:L-threonine aldolase n=1 Tax=Nitrospirillum amazonense TaxID=28077 RepID=A0A560GS33_9PROT|nr:beta-eliminating lyase-related protein [Nitrospirillum amazonense]TWB36449.1 L-threonine aldolase [Nitrospirillum amazonense]